MVNAIFAYRLTVRNTGDQPSAPVTIACDLISAHASLSPAEQLSMPAESLSPSHHVASLAPGESVTLSGEMRLPMAAVRAVRAGAARLFVPLARFAVIDHGDGAPRQAATRVFVIGEGAASAGDKLKPFRIDQGPRTFSQIEQRPVAVPA